MQAQADSAPLFQVRDLTRVYGRGEAAVHALRGVDLEIPASEVVVLLGPSGSGKSTLLHILGGLDRPTGGEVRFQGTSLTAMGDRALTRYRRHHVGFVFQSYNLMPSLTARENVELATEIADDPLPAAEALDLVGLGPRAGHFPAQLSGGEQQRVAFARAVAKRPTVLFCDEPTGALDRATGQLVLRVLVDVNVALGTTMLLVTHAAAIAGLAHRVIHFADGQIGAVSPRSHRQRPEEIVW